MSLGFHALPQSKRGPSLPTKLWPAFPPSSPLSFHKHPLPQDRKSPFGQGQQPQELPGTKVCREETVAPRLEKMGLSLTKQPQGVSVVQHPAGRRASLPLHKEEV